MSSCNDSMGLDSIEEVDEDSSNSDLNSSSNSGTDYDDDDYSEVNIKGRSAKYFHRNRSSSRLNLKKRRRRYENAIPLWQQKLRNQEMSIINSPSESLRNRLMRIESISTSDNDLEVDKRASILTRSSMLENSYAEKDNPSDNDGDVNYENRISSPRNIRRLNDSRSLQSISSIRKLNDPLSLQSISSNTLSNNITNIKDTYFEKQRNNSRTSERSETFDRLKSGKIDSSRFTLYTSNLSHIDNQASDNGRKTACHSSSETLGGTDINLNKKSISIHEISMDNSNGCISNFSSNTNTDSPTINVTPIENDDKPIGEAYLEKGNRFQNAHSQITSDSNNYLNFECGRSLTPLSHSFDNEAIDLEKFSLQCSYGKIHKKWASLPSNINRTDMETKIEKLGDEITEIKTSIKNLTDLVKNILENK